MAGEVGDEERAHRHARRERARRVEGEDRRAVLSRRRGVEVGGVLETLLERKLVKIVGRAEVLGRPMLYGTTKKFLETFGLNSLKDLPKVEELKRPPA